MRRLVKISLAAGALLALTAAPGVAHALTPPAPATPPSSETPGTPPAVPTPAPDPASNSGSSDKEAAMKAREEAKKKAEELKAQYKARADEMRLKAEKAKQEAKSRQADNRGTSPDDRAKKLEENKLRICEKRQTTINRLMGNMSGRGQKQLDMVSTVSTRVQAYVTENDLTAANYDTLLAAVAAAKLAAQTAVDASKEAQVAFKCDGSDPAGAAEGFMANLKAQNDAIKAYRDSVKELIKAVKTVVPTTPAPTPAASGSREGAN